MPKVALLILFNHNFERNLDRLDEIYKGRFDHVWYVMPFYTGSRKDVIRVHESSYHFQGFVAKALDLVRDESFDHYLFIGDDLLLNPKINQENYQRFFCVDKNSAFLPGMFLLTDENESRPYRHLAPYWPWLQSALDLEIDTPGLQVSQFLPSYDQALKRLAAHGLHFEPKVHWKMFVWKNLYSTEVFKALYKRKLSKKYKWALSVLKSSKVFSKKCLPYPVIGSYSDILLVPHADSFEFMQYCGIFSALNLFVEIALPTSLALAATVIREEKDLPHKGYTMWTPEDAETFENRFNKSLANLYNRFPEDALYVHPVKFSRWNS